MTDDYEDDPRFGRIPPHNIQAEEALLGALLLSPKAILDVQDVLTAGDFYKPAHGHIFHAIVGLFDGGSSVDPITVSDELRRAGLLDNVGGPRVLMDLQASCPATTTAPRYAKIILDHSKMRKLVATATEITEMAYGLPDDVESAIDTAETMLFKLNEDSVNETTAPISEMFVSSLNKLDSLFKTSDQITGLSTGLIDLDVILSGLQPSALNVLGARPAMGKTALALNIALHAATTAGTPTLIFSLEMGQLELTQRMLSSEGRISSERLKNGSLWEDDWDKILRAAPKIMGAQLWVDDNPNLTMNDIRAKSRRVKAKVGSLGLIVVDYLQLMSGTDSGNRQEEISKISRGLKILARELECPVLALSQLSRSLEQRNDKRPMLADLRESGAIEQDADVVMFLYRDEMYNPESDDKGTAELIIAKHRNGSTGTVKLAYFGPYTRFASMAKGD